MAACQIMRWLPRRPTNGDERCDRIGAAFRYTMIDNRWLSRGISSEPGPVTESTDGLVTPELYLKLQSLFEAPRSFKISPNLAAYWYLLQSPDHLIRFSVEGPAALRIEVDRGRLYQHACRLYGQCLGPKGPRGARGTPGRDAIGLGPEPYFRPTALSADGLTISFSARVPIVLDTDISLRAYPDDDISAFNPYVDIRYNLTTKKFTVAFVNSTVALDATETVKSLTFDHNTKILTGSLILLIGTWQASVVQLAQPPWCIPTTDDSWCPRTDMPPTPWVLRAHQLGKTGQDGPDATCLFNVIKRDVDNDSISALCPLVHARLASAREVKYVCANVLATPCATQLVADPDVAVSADLTEASFASILPTTDQCKQVTEWRYVTKDFPHAPLELAQWNPHPNCDVSNQLGNYDFNWANRTSTSFFPPAVPSANPPPIPQPAPPPPPSSIPVKSLAWVLWRETDGNCNCYPPGTLLPLTGTKISVWPNRDTCDLAKTIACATAAEAEVVSKSDVKLWSLYDTPDGCRCVAPASTIAADFKLKQLVESLIQCVSAFRTDCIGASETVAPSFLIGGQQPLAPTTVRVGCAGVAIPRLIKAVVVLGALTTNYELRYVGGHWSDESGEVSVSCGSVGAELIVAGVLYKIGRIDSLAALEVEIAGGAALLEFE